MFNQEEFNKFVVDNGIVTFSEKEKELKSGRMSNWYVNWRNAASDAHTLNQLAHYVIEFTKDLGLKPDCFYGVPEGATPLGIITQNEWAKMSPEYAKGSHPLAMGRAKPKEHGDPKDKYFVGKPKGNIILLEDVTTTGGSLLKTIDAFAEAEYNVIAALGMTNRMELRDDGKSVAEAVKDKGITYFNLSDARELIPMAYDKEKHGEDIGRKIEAYFKKYGMSELKAL